MSKGHVMMLVAHTMKDNFSLTEMDDFLSKFNRGISQIRITKYWKDLISCGYVICFGVNPCRYSLTMEGRNALNDLEKRCRETRYDK